MLHINFRQKSPFLLFVVGLTLTLSGCGGNLSQLPVAELQQGKWSYTVTLDEFEEKYSEGNNQEDSLATDSLTLYKDFLNRYVDYRLKVKDAYDKGYDKKPELIKEYKTYRVQLAEPFLMEKELFEKNIKELYDKRKEEIRAAHILALVPKNAGPEDTLKAYQKILDAKALIEKKHAPFDSVAHEFSDDPSVKHNKGELGYFSGGMMVFQFEDAAYQGKKGDLIGPIRTRYGYHLINLLDRRKRTLPIRAAHIMVAIGKNPTPEDTLKAYQKITRILNRIQAGEEFSELAKTFSDDKTSGQRGGDLGFFGLNRMVKPFENAAFALSNVGDISGIVRSPFGYHIIKLLDRQEEKSFEESKLELKRLFQRDKEKVRHENRMLIDELKKRYQYKEYPEGLKCIESKLDTNMTYGMLDSLSKTDLKKVILSFDKTQTYTLDTLVNFLKRSGSGNRKLTGENYEILKNEFSEQLLKDYEISRLDERYPDFARLMQSYKEGILLYKISEDKVWGQTFVSDSLAKAYYESNKQNYLYGPRIEVSHISLNNEALANDLYLELIEGKRTRDVLTKKDLLTQQRKLKRQISKLKRKKDQASKVKLVRLKVTLSRLKVDTEPRSYEQLYDLYMENTSGDSIQTELYENGDVAALDTCFTLEKGAILAPIQEGSTYKIYRLEKQVPPMQKSFTDAKPEVFSELQEYLAKKLESDWVEQLRQKTKIELHTENLNHAFESEP